MASALAEMSFVMGRPQDTMDAIATVADGPIEDGARLTLPGPSTPPVDGPAATGPRRTRTLVLGGASSGKSRLAEDLVAAEPDVVYAATGRPVDEGAPDGEWARRVRVHRERRPSWWRTEETTDVADLLRATDHPGGRAVLLDSVGTWLTGTLDRCGAWEDRPGWREELAAASDALVRAWRARRAPLVAVSDEVGLGVVPATPSGRLFRDELGALNRRLAQESEGVLLVVAGQLLRR